MLYQFLNLFSETGVKYVLLMTSMKIDVTDSFEKRIKSRYSHRQVMLYHIGLNKFFDAVNQTFDNMKAKAGGDADK